MSFHTSQTFTYGEQPSATKWQYLWDNDYALADGSGISDGAITVDHLAEITILQSVSSGFSQASPGNGTWYNVDSISLTAGYWMIEYAITIAASYNSSHQWRVKTTLSTANNSESDAENTVYLNNTISAGGTGNSMTNTFTKSAIFVHPITTTTYYLNVAANTASMGTLTQSGTGPQHIKAIPVGANTTSSV